MREFTVAQTLLECKLEFERMLTMLPGPGGESFRDLARDLHPYGIQPERVTVDASSGRLSDTIIIIGGLLGDRLVIRFKVSEATLFLSKYFEGDDEKLVAILSSVIACLKKVDEDSAKGTATIRSAAHLILKPGEVDAILREHLNLAKTVTSLHPEMAIYRVDLGPTAKAQDIRVGITNSIAYPDAVFIDTTVTYNMPITAEELALTATREVERVYEVLGLREQAPTEE
jgi:hypothetical protein